MRESITLSGVVLYTQAVGEYDKRLVILTNERGKITAFAHGARKAKSMLTAAANPFVFAKFQLYEGKDAYSLIGADVVDYFTELAAVMPGVWYGYYLLELASYYGREGIEAKETVNLIYVSLKAILKGLLDPDLIRSVYEIRTMKINGDLGLPELELIGDRGAFDAIVHSAGAALPSLFSFELKEASKIIFNRFAHETMKRTADKTFKSLAVVEEMR